jgi:hypothetical protein|tara:strand:- start:34 stop:225 length:192 start_codon:yes stop_codon:yes gene_type:complete
MSIKNKIKIKKSIWVNEDEDLCEDLAKSFKGEKDRPRYEEQSEEEYLRHCERFFKGWEDDSKT